MPPIMPNLSPSFSPQPARWHVALWAVSVVTMVLLALRDWNNYSIGVFYDDGVYAVLPRSLLYTAHYGRFFVPPDFQQSALPFGFPLLLAPFVALFPAQPALLRFVPLAASVLSLSLLFWGWRRLTRAFSYDWCVALVVVLAFSPLTVLFARILFSEAVFLMWCLVVFLLTERVASKTGRWEPVALGAAAAALVYTRTIGWVIVATLVLYLIYKLGAAAWRRLAIAALSGGLVVALVVGLTPVEPSDLIPAEYLAILSRANRPALAAQNPAQPGTAQLAPDGFATAFLQRAYGVGRNLLLHLDATDWLPLRMQNDASQFLRATRLEFLKYLPGLAILALLGWGAVRWYRTSGITAFAVIVPPYLLILLIWPWVGSRMFYPVQPQLAFAMLLGMYGVLEWLTRFLPRDAAPRVMRAVSLVTLAVLILISVAVNLRSGAWFLARANSNIYSDWILTHTPPDAVILSSEPATDYLYAERTYASPPDGAYTSRDLIDYLRTYHVTFVIAPAPDNPRTDLVTARTGPIVRYNQTVQELVARDILQPRSAYFDADVTIFQVDAAKLSSYAE